MKEMIELAQAAVESEKIWGLNLDYTSASLEQLEMVAQKIYRSNSLFSLPEDMLVEMANVYGAYLGEVLLRSGLKDLGFAWAKGEEGEIGLNREDEWVWPVTKVYKRITKGPEHSLFDFFDCVFGLVIGAVDPMTDPRIRVVSEPETE